MRNLSRPFLPDIEWPPIKCLNLARRPDRRLNSWQHFRQVGLAVERIVAPDALPVEEARGWRNKGARACAVAHRLAWRAARRTGAEAVVVFEDDVVLCQRFRERLEGLELPEDWAVLYFGCVFRTPPETAGPGLLRVTGPTWDMHGYMMRATLWKELGKEMAEVSRRTKKTGARYDTACDVIVAEYHQKYPAYAVWPPMAWQVDGLSNNENSVRGNYRPDGTQAIYRQCIRHLPGVEEEMVERRVKERRITKRWGEAPAEPTLKRTVAGQSADAGGLEMGQRSETLRPFHAQKVGSAGASPHHFDKAAPRRGFLLSPYSPATERMAWGQVRLLRKYNPDIPVLIYAQDYVPALPWRGIAEVQTARGCHSGKDDLRWLNKLEAICDAPFAETLFFDCDMLSTVPVSGWFEALATDDVSFWQHLRTPENSPDTQTSNLLNPHRFCPHYGVAGVPTMLGGGHYYVRKSRRSQAILDRVAAIMVEAMENPRVLYWDFAGQGNIVGDEPAASMAVVEMGIQLPPPCTLETMPVGCFMPPWQTWRETDFDNGSVRYHCEWAGGEVSPQVVHFAGTGKSDPVYNAWLEKCVTPGAGNFRTVSTR